MGNTGTMIYLAIQIIFAIVLLYYGYKLIKFVIGIGAFLLFGTLAYYFFTRYTDMTDQTALVAALAVGIIAAAIGHFAYKVGFFCIGAYAGYTLALLILSNMSVNSTARIAVLVGAAILCGILAVILSRPAIIVYLSYAGAYNLTFFGSYLLLNFRVIMNGASFSSEMISIGAGAFFASNSTVIFCIIAILFVSGLIVQFRRTGRLLR